MPCTTFVSDIEFLKTTGVASIDEWLPAAQTALGKRIAIQSAPFRTRRWFGRVVTLYSVLVDLGYGEAQIVNFAPRDGSDRSINHYVPEQEIAAWLMGLSSAQTAALAGDKP